MPQMRKHGVASTFKSRNAAKHRQLVKDENKKGREIKMFTVFLEDHGQDFLEWDIKDGVVIDCRPYQGQVWNGTKVHNDHIFPGTILEITPPTSGRTTLRYPVERVVEAM